MLIILEQYKDSLEKWLITWEWDLLPSSNETRTIWFDEYLNSENVMFENCIIRNITMTSANFKNCIFNNCIFEKWAIIWCIFDSCKIISLIFRDTDISFDFNNCSIQHLSFENGWNSI